MQADDEGFEWMDDLGALRRHTPPGAADFMSEAADAARAPRRIPSL